ncbi:MAG: TlpA family protein disulfide reductase [Gemmatimonadales bacterium]|nr:MAG: TlpA family protein disulfide reductase [Gemmatimonadales bacterium]
MSERPKASNLPYYITAALALAVITFAWVNQDRLHAVGPGVQAPYFEAVTLEGEPASLDDYRGQVVLLNIWATWCPPCRYEMPSMQRLYEELEGEDFEIVAVSVDARVGQRDVDGMPGGDIRAFSDSLSLTFPILHDPQGRIRRAYQTRALPESFVIGRDGQIYRKVAGATEWDRPQYVDFIRRLLDGEV